MAVSTLITAALFAPVRRRVQRMVDQAFQPTQVSIWLALPGRAAVSGKIGS